MRFDILGSLQVTDDDARVVPVAAARQRSVLAALLLSANRVLPAESLAETVWDGDPPKGAENTLRAYVMRVRKTVGAGIAARIETRAPGYLFRLAPGELDTDDFEDLCRRAGAAVRAGERWDEVARTTSSALALWRGTPLIDVPSRSLANTWVPRFEQQHLQLLEWQIEAGLESGRSDALIPEIASLLHQHPLRESLYRLHMLALARADRAGEALAVFREARSLLIDQLGVEPGAELQHLHQQILGGAISSRTTPPPAEPQGQPAAKRPARLSKAPRQLPADTRVFAGRSTELDELLALAGAAKHGTEAGMVVISAINGMGGIGKTALAVRAAHRLTNQFPDGQLFIDLRGYSADLAPVSAEDALDYLLRSLGVPPPEIPRDLGEKAALYRTTLADTQTLVILDNASTAAQVRPLLPGTPGCLVMITSRNALAGLDDTHVVELGVLSGEEAVSLLRKVAGPERIEPDDPGAAQLVELCGRLPLAIRIVAARLRRHRSLSPADLVSRLREEAERLQHLRDEERDLSSIFESSYRDLLDVERGAFRHLGLVPGSDFDVHGVASLIGADVRTAERLLESLLDRNLLIQHTLGRYRLHDLLRAYTRGLPASPVADAEAVSRLLDYYQQVVQLANLRLNRQTLSGAPAPSTSPYAAPDIADTVQARTWMRAEQANLIAAIESAPDPGRAITLTELLAPFLRQHGPWTLAARLHRSAAELAAGNSDRGSEANALIRLAQIENVSGRLSSAADLCEQALAGFREIGDRRRQALALCELGRIKHISGDLATASDVLEQAVPFFRDSGDLHGEADALIELARVHQLFGRAQAVLASLERALALFRRIGNRIGEANTLMDLAYGSMVLGLYAQGEAQARQAEQIYQEVESVQGEGNALGLRGQMLISIGDHATARTLFERKLITDDRIGFRMGRAIALHGLGHCSLADGDHQSAVDDFESSIAIFEEGGYELGRAEATHGLARTRHAAGDHTAAAELLQQALTIFRDCDDRQNQAAVLNSIGALALDTAQPEAALARYRQALEIAREACALLDEAHALEGAARSLEALADPAAARAELREAVKLYQRMGVAEHGPAADRLAALGSLDGPDRPLG